MKLTRSCRRPLAILVTFALVAVLSVLAAASAAAQPDPSAAALCSQHHGFGAQPVDIAKTADHTRVLAQVQWGYSAPGGYCYLVLDDAAVDTLRANAHQLPDPSPNNTDPQAAALCSQHHGFGAQPVDVAKTADHTRVLAQVQWGYSAPGGFCYLTLNPAATQTLRNPDTEDDTPTTPEELPADNTFTIPEGPRGDDTLITAGRGRTCAVRIDGGVACWGRYGSVDRFALGGLTDVVAVTTADSRQRDLHACVLHEDRTISCWGDGDGGKLAQGDNSVHFLPVKVPRITDAVAVSAGEEHTCALHSDGGVSCWGRFYSAGRVGGANAPDYLPYRVTGLSDVVMISAGRANHCAIHSDGDISCWGVNYPITDSGPKRFNVRDPFTVVSNGTDQICAVSVAGRVYCWGRGQSPAVANRVGSLTDVVDVSVGDATTCALHGDGGVSCWGGNDSGELGDGTTTPRQWPNRVAGVSDAVAVSVSKGSENITAHVCALRADGSALCWGGNEAEQLGDGTSQNRLSPTPVEPIVPIPADQVPLTPTELLHTWAEAVVQEREAEYPWMRVAWDHIRDQAIASQSGFGGLAFRSCFASATEFGCRIVEMQITFMTLGVFAHELLHVYDLHTGLAPPKAWGAVQLYFATTYPGCWSEGEIGGAEILADTVNHLINPTAWLTYYESRGCPEITPGSKPTDEAEEVVLQGMAGQVPDWYQENITNGAELWAAWVRGPSLPALANLADEFGGLCNTDWITYPLDPERFPPADSNPFKDGGC